MSLRDVNDDKLTLAQVMAWCRQAPSYYLSLYMLTQIPSKSKQQNCIMWFKILSSWRHYSKWPTKYRSISRVNSLRPNGVIWRCVSRSALIWVMGDGLSFVRRQAITWTNADLFMSGPLGRNFSEISMKIQQVLKEDNWFEYVVCKMDAILSRVWCVNMSRQLRCHYLGRVVVSHIQIM